MREAKVTESESLHVLGGGAHSALLEAVLLSSAHVQHANPQHHAAAVLSAHALERQ